MSDQLERVNTAQLMSGDIVHAHGARFQLLHCTINRSAHGSDGRLYSFATKCLSADDDCPIHPSSRDRWTIQGNDRAMWLRVARKFC